MGCLYHHPPAVGSVWRPTVGPFVRSWAIVVCPAIIWPLFGRHSPLLFGHHPPPLLGHHSFGQSPLPLGHCSTNCHFSTTTQPLPATVRLIIAAIQPLFGPATILQSPSFAIGHRCLVVVLASALCHLPLFGRCWFKGWLCRWSPKLLSSSLFILHELHLF